MTARAIPPDPAVPSEWRRKGYITVLRRNWHLLDYAQLLTVLDMTRTELRYALIEDDFLFVKLGNVKPKCGPLVWSAAAAARGRGERLRLAKILKEEGADDFTEGALFEAAALDFRSAADQTRSIMARDAGDRAAMRAAAVRELDAAKRFLPLVRGDSRIGFECSNHYFYVPQDVREKILCCRAILDHGTKQGDQ